MDTPHVFALYIPELSQTPSVYTLRDEALVHRIVHVLRLAIDEEMIFFNREMHATAHIKKIEKKYIEFVIYNKEPNTILKPSITLALPILKREAFQEAIYAATELGATIIQPLITAKVHRGNSGPKEHERLERIIIAAAEQSKNYALPELREPISLEEYLASVGDHDVKIFCDPQGAKACDVIKDLTTTNPIILMVGPEGDLTQDEKNNVHSKGFKLCALTPTVLRAQQAAMLGLGLLRSCL